MSTAPANALTEATLAEMTRRLVAALSPRAVYLFGSHVYGRPHAGSDVDVLVVLPDEDFSTWDVAKSAYGALDGTKVPVELHFTWQDRFARLSAVRGSFEEEIHTKGRLLYAA
jgi:predicted nucleotidyltransferase